MGWILTEDLTPGTEVLVGHEGYIRTVASVDLTDLTAYVNGEELPVYAACYAEGETEEWPPFNYVVYGVQWPTAKRPHRPHDPGLWDQGDPVLEWEGLTPPSGKHRA